MNFEKVLVVSPHTDDGELGAGGTIARFIDEGKEVYSIVLSIAEESVPEGFPKDALEGEARQAQGVLGIKPQNLSIYRHKVRKFPSHREEILELLVSFQRTLMPDLVIIPSPQDLHQDHRTVAEEAIRAFKQTTILGYEEPWNLLEFKSCCLVCLEERHIQKKIEAIRCYETQEFRNYSNPEFLKALAQVRGVQAGCRYAEAFDVIRLVFK